MTDGDVDPRFDPRFQRGFDPSVHEEESRRAPVSRPAATHDDEHPARNPYRLALLIISLFAIIAGIAIVGYAATHQDQIYGERGVPGIFAALAGSYIAPGLLGGGVIGVALWAAVGALRTRGDTRGEPTRDEPTNGATDRDG